MYIHEEENGKNKYFIMAIIFHVALIIGVLFFKNNNNEEAPPESSTAIAELSEDNLDNSVVDEELLEKSPEEEVDLDTQKLNANAVSSKEVNEAIDKYHEKINKEKQEKIEEQKRIEQEKITEKKRIEEEKLALIKKEQEIKEKKEKEIQEKINKEKQEKENAIKKQKELENKKKKELEAKKNKELEAQKKKLELEKIKKAEAERKRKSAEAIKKAEIERQKIAQAKRNSLNNRGYNSTQKSLSNNEKLAMLKLYRDQVYNKVYSNWIRPSYSKRGWECKVHVTQSNRGEVKSVKIVRCQGDKTFQDSVKKAIFKSSPLPLPKHPSLFNSTIEITFKVT